MRRLLLVLIVLSGIGLLQAQTDFSNYQRATTDTVKTTWVDTLSRKIISTTSNSLSDLFRMCYTGDIICDDTVSLSISASFPANNTQVILPNIQTSLPVMSILTNTNLYLKTRGWGTGARYYIRIWGN